MPKRVRRRLKTGSDVRRYLANLINRVEGGQIEPDVAAKIGYLINILIRCIEGSELEQRVTDLERLMETSNEKSKIKGGIAGASFRGNSSPGRPQIVH